MLFRSMLYKTLALAGLALTSGFSAPVSSASSGAGGAELAAAKAEMEDATNLEADAVRLSSVGAQVKDKAEGAAQIELCVFLAVELDAFHAAMAEQMAEQMAAPLPHTSHTWQGLSEDGRAEINSAMRVDVASGAAMSFSKCPNKISHSLRQHTE